MTTLAAVKNIASISAVWTNKMKIRIKNFNKGPVLSGLFRAKPRRVEGFTLLLSVLIVTIVTAISFSFSAFITKELKVSSVGRESMKALFASDSGAECAFYWEFKGGAFATSSTYSTVTCAGVTVPVIPSPKAAWDGWPATATSTFAIRFDNGSCAVIGINKRAYPPNFDKFRIVSWGRNIGDSNCHSTSPDRVERALKIEF